MLNIETGRRPRSQNSLNGSGEVANIDQIELLPTGPVSFELETAYSDGKGAMIGAVLVATPYARYILFTLLYLPHRPSN